MRYTFVFYGRMYFTVLHLLQMPSYTRAPLVSAALQTGVSSRGCLTGTSLTGWCLLVTGGRLLQVDIICGRACYPPGIFRTGIVHTAGHHTGVHR